MYLEFKDSTGYHKLGKVGFVDISYKLDKETDSWKAYIAEEREDGCFEIELYQFTSSKKSISLRVLFNDNGALFPRIHGIEFQPMKNIKDDKKMDAQPNFDLNGDWESQLPSNYKDIIKKAHNVTYSSKKQLYIHLRRGILIKKEMEKERYRCLRVNLLSIFFKRSIEMWFFLDENGKKCLMLPATYVWEDNPYPRRVELGSRFDIIEITSRTIFSTYTYVPVEMLSNGTLYGCYLVYKLPVNKSELEGPMQVNDTMVIYLINPETPVIRPKDDQNSHNPSKRSKMIFFPRQRNDGWMEVPLYGSYRSTSSRGVLLQLKAITPANFYGLLVQGIEFRPK